MVSAGKWAVTRTVQRNPRAHAGERVNDDPPPLGGSGVTALGNGERQTSGQGRRGNRARKPGMKRAGIDFGAQESS